MSRYYASIDGQASTEATRRGSTNSGIFCHVRAWNIGVKVSNIHDETGELDGFEVDLTGGSNMSGKLEHLVRVERVGDKIIIYHSSQPVTTLDLSPGSN